MKKSMEIFKKDSIEQYEKILNEWVKHSGVVIYYYGSFFFDINGDRYDRVLHEWPTEKDMPLNEGQKQIQLALKQKFESADFWKKIPLTITEIIQRKLLKYKGRVLHLYCEQTHVADKVTVKFMCEQIPAYPLIEVGESVELKELNKLLSANGESLNLDINSTFKEHFNLISGNGSHIYFFPTVLRLSDNVINVTTIISPSTLERDMLFHIQGGLSFCSENLLADTLKYLSRKAEKEAIKSAKAAIMSRNMSHNIGSHVMSYLKQHLSSVTTIINDNVLAEMITSSRQPEAIKSDTPLPFLVGMGHFLSYLQERQDFIATIATDYIPYFAPVNFKDFIYDELNADKRFERHKDRKNLQPDNILLGNIARSEGLGRTIQPTITRSSQLSDIVLKYRCKVEGLDSDGNIIVEDCVFDGESVVNESNSPITGREGASKALENMRTLEVNLPGGVIGRQAIFSIVENIIRNTAKHGNWREQGKLELTFEVFDAGSIPDEFKRLKQQETKVLENAKPLLDRMTMLSQQRDNGGKLSEAEQSEYDWIKEELYQRLKLIWEQLAKWNEDATDGSNSWMYREKHLSLMEVLWSFYSGSLDADDLYFVTITDNVRVSEDAVKKLRIALIEDYIDAKTNKMIDANKGIKEIRISAAWLRGAKEEDNYYTSGEDLRGRQQTTKKAPLVYVRQHYGCLQYIICLQKPRNVAIVTKNSLVNNAKAALKELNWRYYTPEEFKHEQNKSYRFTLCENGDLYNEIRPYSSSRVYVPDIPEYWDKIKAGISKEDGAQLIRLLYQSLVEDKVTIWIDDDKAIGNMHSRISEDVNYAVNDGDKSYRVNHVDVRVVDGLHFSVDYIYRKHHDTLEQFKTFMKDNSNWGKFVESITGNTSTDRLVRNEKYDYRWYYSHLNAMRKKVAVFDERLFSRIYGREESDFTKGNATDLENLKKLLIEKNIRYKNLIGRCKTIDELNKVVKEKKFTVVKVSKSNVYTKDHIALTYYQKGVCFYTLIKDSYKELVSVDGPEKKISFGVYGLVFEDGNKTSPQYNKEYACHCDKIATITWDNNEPYIEFETSSAAHIENQFDFITIHQGLLDKLYEAFKIKDKEKKKILLTNKLHEKFGKKSSDENVNARQDGFVPGLIIHSGRSKPAENDMPQKLPFLQYASIEHDVLDSKYTLIDLLENARYEQ